MSTTKRPANVDASSETIARALIAKLKISSRPLSKKDLKVISKKT